MNYEERIHSLHQEGSRKGAIVLTGPVTSRPSNNLPESSEDSRWKEPPEFELERFDSMKNCKYRLQLKQETDELKQPTSRHREKTNENETNPCRWDIVVG